MIANNFYRNLLQQRLESNQFRILKNTQIFAYGHAERNGKNLINFASNDYLGLSQHPAVIAAAAEAAQKYGAGATASRLVTGNHPLYDVIEKRLAEGKGTETALVMNGGYQTNLTVLAALADQEVVGKSIILADRLIHNSLLQGAILSGARLIRFQHNDNDHLQTLLQKYPREHKIIVTESVFGMDGDRADLKKVIDLSQKFGALLYVDEAHATGVYGANGFGLCADFKGKIDVVMGTFGKALGSFGAYIACSKTLRDYLIQRCGGLIYSTALPPAILGSIDAALAILPALQKERDDLHALSNEVRAALTDQGWNCGHSTTHIIPVILGDEISALKLSELLFDLGILISAIRPPTVPRGTSRLRVSLSAAHRHDDIQHFVAVMAAQAPNFSRAT